MFDDSLMVEVQNSLVSMIFVSTKKEMSNTWRTRMRKLIRTLHDLLDQIIKPHIQEDTPSYEPPEEGFRLSSPTTNHDRLALLTGQTRIFLGTIGNLIRYLFFDSHGILYLPECNVFFVSFGLTLSHHPPRFDAGDILIPLDELMEILGRIFIISQISPKVKLISNLHRSKID